MYVVLELVMQARNLTSVELCVGSCCSWAGIKDRLKFTFQAFALQYLVLSAVLRTVQLTLSAMSDCRKGLTPKDASTVPATRFV
jgi:hypothetical protein